MYRQFDLAGRALLRNSRKKFQLSQYRYFRPSVNLLAQKDHYQTLGVDKKANEKELKAAFFKMAKKYHPDANPDDPNASDKFSEVNEAYQTLSDKNKRAEYDMFGTSGGASGGFSSQGSDANNMNMQDIFENLFGMGQKQKREGSGARVNTEPGEDIQVEMDFMLEEVMTETKKDIKVRVEEKCGTCKGNGQKPGSTPVRCGHCKGTGMISRQSGFMIMQQTCPYCQGEGISVDPCTTCDGHGLQAEAKNIQITVPAGVDDGMRVRIPSQGSASRGHGTRGHVYVLCQVKPHSRFERIKSDLHVKAVIPLSMAILGGSLEIKLPNNKKIEYKVAAGTQSGHMEKIRAKGMPDPRSGMFGHLFVHVQVNIPSSLDEKTKELIEQFKKEEVFKEPRMDKPNIEHLKAKEGQNQYGGFRGGFR